MAETTNLRQMPGTVTIALTQTNYRNSVKLIPNQPQSIKVAGFFRELNKGFNSINRTQRILEREARQERWKKEQEKSRLEREERMRVRSEEAIKRREEFEAARRAAVEKRRLEAERRRQYFESLSPEQQQAYIKKQQEIRRKQTEFITDIFLKGISEPSGEAISRDEIYERQQRESWEHMCMTVPSAAGC